MEKIFLLLTVLFEIVYATLCIVRKSSQRKVKYIERITALVIFAVLCITPIIDFDFRWYGFGALLFILAIINYIRRKKVSQFSIGKTVFSAIGMSIMLFFMLIPALVFPQADFLEPTGEFKVDTITYTYTDDTRTDKSGNNAYVNVAFWYPMNAKEQYPLVVFDHGAYGVKDSNYSAFVELASHGYVVCSIDHPGHSFYTKSEDGKIKLIDKKYLDSVNYTNTEKCTAQEAYDYIQEWMNVRVTDMNFTIDTILNYVKDGTTSKPYSLINPDKIGVFGHSMGAASSVWIGRVRNDVSAVVNIDGPYFSEIQYDASTEQLIATGENYSKPILNIYSDDVWCQLKDGTTTGSYAGNKISNQICKNSYDVYLEGSKHLTLTDLAIISPFLTNMLNGQKANIDIDYCLDIERKAILEFFDCYLKDGADFSMEGCYTSK